MPYDVRVFNYMNFANFTRSSNVSSNIVIVDQYGHFEPFLYNRPSSVLEKLLNN